ncbi:hypothetical protein VTJ83DRAFT_4934 [Remersonia thermophila]|uniref:Uncharacterized protein n=1 Tax=Remersonia thermophila TaxID=72144 RepID=A0ABR4DBL0_9PEZI
MASSGSSRELSRTLNSYLQSPTLPLPSEIYAVITAYIEKHNKPDDAASERLNDELIAVWEKVVQNHPERYAAFLSILKELRPALRMPARTFKWWDRLLDPVLEHVTSERGLAKEAMEHIIDLVAAEEVDDPTAWSEDGLVPLISRLIERWVALVESPPDTDPSIEMKQAMVKDALLAFGRRDPKDFMTALNAFVVEPDHRNSALSLLCSYLASGPPHLHQIKDTPLFGSVLQSLQRDESTTTVNLALMALVMILPFIPSSLVPLLPTLFSIYGRLLFWDRDSYFTKQNTELGATHAGGGIPWKTALLAPDRDGHTIRYLAEYFTMLYGLYPLNFVDYIRKPHRYLRHAGVADEMDLPVDEMRERSEHYRKRHMLHPNFIHLTIDSEKSDMNRWVKSEADEVLADCMALLIDRGSSFPHIEPSLPERPFLDPAEALDREGAGSALLGQADDDVSDVRPPGVEAAEAEAPTPADTAPDDDDEASNNQDASAALQLPAPSPPVSTRDGASSLRSVRSMQGGLQQPSLPGDGAPCPGLLSGQKEHPGEPAAASGATDPSGGSVAGADANVQRVVTMLQRERLKLINDLQYERFIKEQHMIHMGELRRRQMRVSATEAETQNLIMANRSLRHRLEEAKRGEAQIKKESDRRRDMSKKYEIGLNNKLRVLRDEQEKRSQETSDLGLRLRQAQAECDKLRAMVVEAEQKQRQAEQDLEAADVSTAAVEKLRGEIARLSASEREYQGKEAKLETAMQEATLAEARARELEREVAAREEELRKVEEHYKARIEELRGQIARASQEQHQQRPRLSDEAEAKLERFLSGSRSRYAALQKQHDALAKKCAALEEELLDLRCKLEQPPTSAAGNDEGAAGARGRGPGSLDVKAEGEGEDESEGEGGSRPVATDGPAGSGPQKTAGSHPERFHGRGEEGHGSSRRDRKDKKKEEGKEKKPVTIRAIRGFI